MTIGLLHIPIGIVQPSWNFCLPTPFWRLIWCLYCLFYCYCPCHFGHIFSSNFIIILFRPFCQCRHVVCIVIFIQFLSADSFSLLSLLLLLELLPLVHLLCWLTHNNLHSTLTWLLCPSPPTPYLLFLPSLSLALIFCLLSLVGLSFIPAPLTTSICNSLFPFVFVSIQLPHPQGACDRSIDTQCIQ